MLSYSETYEHLLCGTEWNQIGFAKIIRVSLDKRQERVCILLYRLEFRYGILDFRASTRGGETGTMPLDLFCSDEWVFDIQVRGDKTYDVNLTIDGGWSANAGAG